MHDIRVTPEGRFQGLSHDEVVTEADSLDKIKKVIDQLVQVKAKRLTGLTKTNDQGRFLPVQITSVRALKSAYSTTYSYNFRCSWKEHGQIHWEEKSSRSIYKDTPQNRELFAQIRVFEEREQNIYKAKRAAEDKLQFYTDEELLEK